MKENHVIEYVAKNGTTFRDKTACLDYERELDMLEPIISKLPKSPVKLGHCEYIPCDLELIKSIKRQLFRLVLNKHGQDFPLWKNFDPDEVLPMSIVGRVLDDYGGALHKAWSKLYYYDFVNGRLCEQPYVALNPEEGILRKI